MDDPASLFLLFFAETTAAVPFDVVSTALNFLLVMFLVVGNGFFVASEFSLVAVRKSRIEALAEEGNAAAVRVLGMLDNLNEYISATQLGITLFSLGLGWVGEPAVASTLEPIFIWFGELTGLAFLTSGALLHTISFAIAFSIITFLHIVFGELAPKTAALALAEKVSFFIAVPLQIFYRIFKYPIRVLDWAGTRTARAFGLATSDEHGASYSEDEIRKLIRASQEKGILNVEEQKLLDKVFEFSDTTVKEAMIPRPEIVALSVKSTLDEILERFAESGYSRLPVYRGSLDDIAGYIHSKDIIRFLRRPKTFRIERLLKKPHYVVDTAHLEDVLRQMQSEKFRFGFVVDEHGGVEGIITLEDLLEEIVGDISDEHDDEVNEQIDEQKDGSYILDGGLAVRDLNKRLGLNIPVSEGYTTIAGFLMSEAGQLLSEGQTVPFNGHTFYIEKVDRRRIKKVKLQKTEQIFT
jgi:CBS domain containing-hemolysin-like protein